MKTVCLNTGKVVPILGFGTWKAKPGEVENAVKHAINVGYRHIDSAYAYGNEAEVGAAVREKMQDGTVKREDLFICTKLWNSQHAPEDVMPSLKASLEAMGLDYIDLYLIHWPMALKPGKEKFPRDADGNLIFADISYCDTYKALENCVEAGLTKAIGLSNFNKQQVEDVLNICTIKPAMNQLEVNPYFPNESLVQFCQSQGITVTAYSPLGSKDRPWASPDEPVIIEDPKLKAIAQRVGKSVAQVILRWLVQRDIMTIPKSVTPSRIEENMKVFDFELSDEDMKAVSAFDRKCPLVVPMVQSPDGKQVFRDLKAPNFPFTEYFDRLLELQNKA